MFSLHNFRFSLATDKINIFTEFLDPENLEKQTKTCFSFTLEFSEKFWSRPSYSASVKGKDFLQWKYYVGDRPLFVILMHMPGAWLSPFRKKVPQKSSRGESTIDSGIRTTFCGWKVVDFDHVGHFSQNRRKSLCMFVWFHCIICCYFSMNAIWLVENLYLWRNPRPFYV